MLHPEVRFLWSNNLLFNPKIVICCVSSTITLFLVKGQNYFEVMINYMVAVTLHARRNNVMSLVWILPNFHFQKWYNLCHEFILDWFSDHSHSWTQSLCIKHSKSDLHLPQFSSCHDDSPQCSSVKADRQQMGVRWQEFVSVVHVLYLWSWAVLHCWITLLLQKTYLVDVVWLLL